MRINYVIGAMLALLVTTGCVSIPRNTAPVVTSAIADARMADRALEQNEARVQLNIKPGYFSSVTVKPEATQTYGLVLERLNPHQVWTSLQTLCATGEPGGRMICVNIRLPVVGAERFEVDIRTRSPNGASEHLATVPGNFFLGREIRVKTIVGPTSVDFEIDGKPMLGKPIAYKADALQLGCSSAECIFTMLSIF